VLAQELLASMPAIEERSGPEPPVLHIGVNNQAPTLIVGGKMFQGLLRYDAELEPMPELAKSWRSAPTGKEYTFKLQENVKFHDGKPMTADDVIFSIMKFHMEVSPRARGVFARIKEGVASTRPRRSSCSPRPSSRSC
jgi:peptide/nickel transport system substrate-binding protein